MHNNHKTWNEAKFKADFDPFSQKRKGCTSTLSTRCSADPEFILMILFLVYYLWIQSKNFMHRLYFWFLVQNVQSVGTPHFVCRVCVLVPPKLPPSSLYLHLEINQANGSRKRGVVICYKVPVTQNFVYEQQCVWVFRLKM